MSINQIQEIDKFPGWRSWLNSRVDDLNIYSRLDLDIDLAVQGDILILDSSLEPTWVPNSSLLAGALDNMMTTPQAFTFTVGADLPIQLSNSYVISSPNITVNSNGELVLANAGIYLLCVNFNVNVTATTVNPSLSLQRWNSNTNTFVNDLEGLGISAYVPFNGSSGLTQTLCSIWPVILPLPNPTNNRFRIIGSNPGQLNTSLINTDSSLSVIRIS